MYVIDATGSMQDELSYIKREIRDVVEKVAAANPESEIRLSFLFYRDDFDEEKFMFLDFVTTDDDAKFAEQLRAIAPVDACGGDDYPEAVDEALLLAADANWSTEATTKIVFHVLDAPAHETPEVKARYSEAVRKAAEKGIRLCPVLSSGADTLTEYLCRSEAVLTGGTFVYLTDDSGIGGGHLDPDLPDAVVEYLNALMIRLINGYHTGSFADPVPWNAAE